ncbi:serine hydrolase domain-containing protein [Streptantibioticus rubrisoli]|uniref:Beta-lactamase family protein n=1 Tax=Streptantibioticus rubrisoli TaxID=1387313 RepID=A0ABT1P698_9ACTN|nr:serine hydrolase domain-containing protein [Streptantibioticus rubrisoli]MCQ4040889.1 beta-lactamase family protein [Streptantibioticus rubrisoli]
MKPLAHRVTALSLVGAAFVGLTAGSGTQAFAATSARTSTVIAFPSLDPSALQAAIQTRPTDDTSGAIARVGEPGQLWKGSTIDSQTGRKIPDNAHFHIGSISKVFETTVILQLASEGRIDLDQTVQHYMPGLLPGIFQPITVRELINYTSGLPDVDEAKPADNVDETIANRFRYRTFDEIIQTTLRPTGRPWPGPHFAPGTKQEYNSLGFRIAGKLIERITGHSFKEEVTARVLKPLRLDQTSVPEDDPRMPQPYLHGYITNSQGRAVDVSEQGGDPSNMISTPADLDRFITALFRGRLLPAAQLNEMFTLPRDHAGNLVPFVGGTSCNKQACFGAGLMSTPLPDGSVLWGKTGHDDGYANGMFATRDLSLRGIYSVSNLSLDFGAPTPLANRLLTAVLTPAASHG